MRFASNTCIEQPVVMVTRFGHAVPVFATAEGHGVFVCFVFREFRGSRTVRIVCCMRVRGLVSFPARISTQAGVAYSKMRPLNAPSHFTF
jgi:hypothetical protein